ncbi:MAG TPA: DUF4432 family protein [Mycobacteriales bacterium]|nr:DUF4432 family protein [Mycobacteriales bacterium]
MIDELPVPESMNPIRLTSADLLVEVLAGKGADIYRIIDRASGIDVLFKTPWGLRDPSLAPSRATSMEAWTERYPGGWQVLCPNADFERIVEGTRWDYHGEAAMLPWHVRSVTETSISLAVRLFTAPLDIEREISVRGPVIEIHERVTNNSPDEQYFEWVHHPAFGPPFAGGGCRLATGARTLLSDAKATGNLLQADTVNSWPHAKTAAGGTADLSVLAGPESRQEIFACLTDFTEPYFALTNPQLGFGVALRWPAEIFPHAWFWQEFHASKGFPWFRRAYSAAIEPSNVIPGSGRIEDRQRGGGAVLAGGESSEAKLTFSRFADRGTVVGVTDDGEVHFA